MPKIVSPISFTSEFQIDKEKLDEAGVINTFLNVDTNLFIDPFLLQHSQHKEISTDAIQRYQNHFSLIIKLLKSSARVGDPAWKS